MAFNTWPFVAMYLPVTLLGFGLVSRARHPAFVKLWLIAASLVFYGWGYPPAIGLLSVSIGVNYLIAKALHGHVPPTGVSRQAWLAFGVAMNLAFLGYWKYQNFFLENVGLTAISLDQPVSVVIPLGLSFLTFQQIAYLVDHYRGEAGGESLLDYCLFVTFFPKLMAGPIIRQGEFISQLRASGFGTFAARDLAEGVTLFTIGLFKKVVLADNLAAFVDPIFEDAAAGVGVSCWQAWGGMLGYTFQLYFDFAGYTDMAIGLARMFGLELPQNFNLPYTATNIREFWRRWHITFSRFLRDYLYIPLGGSRAGPIRTGVNLMLTMLLGGLWHGAGWTFLVWGALHGSYLIINHAWTRVGLELPRTVTWAITFFGIAYAWVWFRAETVGAAGRMTLALLDIGGLFPTGFPGFIKSILHLEPVVPHVNLAVVVARLGLSLPIGGETIYPLNILLSTPLLMLTWLAVAGLVAFRLPNVFEQTARDLHPTPMPLSGRRAVIVVALIYLVLMSSIMVDRSGFVYAQF